MFTVSSIHCTASTLGNNLAAKRCGFQLRKCGIHFGSGRAEATIDRLCVGFFPFLRLEKKQKNISSEKRKLCVLW